MTTRRNLFSLGLTGAALTLSPALVKAALAQARTIGAIRVDTSHIARQGWGENAERIRIAMERQLAETLGPLYQRGKGATLHVLVKGVWLSNFAGGSGRSTGGGGSNDNFDSEITVFGSRGEVLQTFPILSVVDSGSGGAWYRPDVDQRRVAALIENNSLWIKRYLGG